MKFLLAAINAKYIHSNPAVYSLRAYAGEEGRKQAEIAEYTINMQTGDILSDLCRRRPDAIGFSCYIWNWEMIRRLLPELAKLLPDTDLWLGGPEVSFDAEEIVRDLPMVTGVMTGEGEETFAELLSCYRKAQETDSTDGAGAAERLRRQLPGIRGIVFYQDGRAVRTGEREPLSLDRLPFYYEEAVEDFKNRMIYYESSRGCPFRCSYCLSSIDKRVRFRSPGKVEKELQFFLDRRVAQVKFVDRTFNCDEERTKAIWRYLLLHDNQVTNFHFEIAAELLTEEELAILSAMRPGLVQLEIGVQSANPETLREINRSENLCRLKETTTRILKGKNIHIHLDLIAGLPFEDYESFGRSFDTVYRMRPHQLQLGFLKVLKGSPIHEKAADYGINYTFFPPYEVLYSRWISYEEICRLKRIEEMVELYYNSGQFTHTLPVLEEAFEGPFHMYERLSLFYEENGYFTGSPSRLYRYDALFHFACRYDPEREALYRELLTFDLYLRENLKSRPDFIGEGCVSREQVRSFYRREEKERRLLPAYEGCTAGQLLRMTHVEGFCYQVWKEAGEDRQIKAGKGAAALFDYRKRDPLTGDARVIPIVL